MMRPRRSERETFSSGGDSGPDSARPDSSRPDQGKRLSTSGFWLGLGRSGTVHGQNLVNAAAFRFPSDGVSKPLHSYCYRESPVCGTAAKWNELDLGAGFRFGDVLSMRPCSETGPTATPERACRIRRKK